MEVTSFNKIQNSDPKIQFAGALMEKTYDDDGVEVKWIILVIVGIIGVSLTVFMTLHCIEFKRPPPRNLDSEKNATKNIPVPPVKKSNVSVAGISKNEQQSRSDDDTNIGENEDEHKEQTVKSELGFSKTHNQDDNMALKLKSVENSLDRTNAELEKVRQEKEDLETQLAEMIFTQNDDAEDSIHKSSDVLNRMIEDCDQMIGKLNEKIEYLKFENEIEK